MTGIAWSVEPGWGLDADVFDEVDGIAVADDGEVHLFGRWPARVQVHAPDGALRAAWGGTGFSDRPHGLAVAGDLLWCVDAGASALVALSRSDGSVVRTLGEPGAPSDTGVDWAQPDTTSRLRTVAGGPPFNRPTDVAIAPDGTLLVADGYGNCRIHRLTPDGDLLASWGTPGSARGAFNLPHGIAIGSDGSVYVCDRENDRVQVFDLDGTPTGSWEDLRLPSGVAVGPDGLVLVAEVGKPSWRRSLAHPDEEPDHPARISVRRPDGTVVGEVGRCTGPIGEPGVLLAPHCVAVGPDGSVFVGELAAAVAAARGLDRDLPAVQRFACSW